MNELNNFRKSFDLYFLKSIKDNISKAKKHTQDLTIQEYLDYVYNVALNGKRVRPFIISMILADHNKKINKDLMLGIEYLHLFALIHDDIMDNSDLRHGVPTIHKYLQDKLGLTRDQAINQTIVIGDLVFNWAYIYIFKAGKSDDSLCCEYTNLISELIVGQMLDTDLPRRVKVDESLVVEKSKIKSGRYTFARPMKLGAIECHLNKKLTKQYFDLGEELGLLYQLVDDEIDATSKSTVLGKKTFQDFKEKQHTLVSFFLLNKTNKKHLNIFKEKLWGKEINEKDFDWVQEFLRDSGALAYVEENKKSTLAKIQNKIKLLSIDKYKKQKWYDFTEIIYNRKK